MNQKAGYLSAAIALALLAVTIIGVLGTKQPAIAPAAEASHSAGPDAASEAPPEKQAKLVFRPMPDAEQPIGKVKANAIPKSDIARTIEFDGHRYIVFARPDSADSSERFIGLAGEGVVYVLGTAGGDAYEKEIKVGKAEAFGQTYVGISGYCGANCAVQRYVQLKDGVPVRNYLIHYAAWVSDWSGDGTGDLLYLDGMPLDTKLVRLKDGKLECASVDEAVRSTGGVVYDEAKKRFNVYEGEQVVPYRYEQGDRLIMDTK